MAIGFPGPLRIDPSRLHDLLGLQQELAPKFLKRYCDGFSVLKKGLDDFYRDVKGGVYPCEREHVYG